MRSLLITGAAKPDGKLIEALEAMGWHVFVHQQETEPVSTPERYGAVVCNGLFLYNDISRFTSLKIVQLTSAGLDRVPVAYIRDHAIELYNARGVYSAPMAEWAVMVILDVYKHSLQFAQSQHMCRWEKNRNLRELAGKSVAIIGAGNIGGEVARRLRAFDCIVTGYDIVVHQSDDFERILPISDLDVRCHDILILTAPHTPLTHHIMDRSRLLSMKPDALLVNMSRGGLVDETALADVLNDRPDIRVILDVFEVEPLESGSPLWHLPNLRIFPHNSFVGEFNTERLHRVIVSNLSHH